MELNDSMHHKIVKMIFRSYVSWCGFSFKNYNRTHNFSVNRLVRQFQSLSTLANPYFSSHYSSSRYHPVIRWNQAIKTGKSIMSSSNTSISPFSSSSSPECPHKKSCSSNIIGVCECECANAKIDCIQWPWENETSHYPTPSPPPASLFEFEKEPENSTEGQRTTSFLMGTMNQPLTVCVEGNIGSGKTTFLKYFKKYSEVCVLDEPISKWRDCQGYNLLDLMYKDPRKWSLCFQSYVQLTMLDLHTKPIAQPIKMMERSIFSAQYCFVQNLRDEGLMEDSQYAVLSEWFNFSMANLPIKVDLIVYLRTDPEVAFKRIGQRGRSEENSIKLEYLQSVHKHHEEWLVHNQKLLPCPVLTIDANTELADMTPNYQLCEEKMFQKVAVAN